MKITLIRHTSVNVAPGTCYGQTDVPLAPTFESEAEAVKQRLNGRRFNRVFTSPLSRCRRLAEYCGYPDATIDDRLIEMNFGAWEMQRYDNITDPRLQEWYDDYINVRATGGESFKDQRSRFTSFIEEITAVSNDDDEIALFTHGGILIQAMMLYNGLTAEEAFTNQPSYGAIMTIEP